MQRNQADVGAAKKGGNTGTWWGVLIAIGVMAYLGAFAMRNYVLVDFVTVIGGSLLISIFAGIAAAPLFRKILRVRNFSLCVGIAIAFLTGILTCGFYMTNMICADEESEYTERAFVKRKYQETHYKSKRVTRKTYARGAPYQEYYLEVEYADGRTGHLLINKSLYSRVSSQDSIEVKMRKGLWGIPVVKGERSIDHRIGAKRRTRLSSAR